MSERAEPLDAETLKIGLLMESAQSHQKLAEAHLEKLKAHTRDLDGVVRDEIRRTLVAELQALTAETERASRALSAMRLATHVRGLSWNIGSVALCTLIPAGILHLLLPSPQALAALRTQQATLTASVTRLTQAGGKAEWHRCGPAARLCVRIERDAAVYGEKADYYVVKGY